jgi:AmmeMemoRadiSam system protein A
MLLPPNDITPPELARLTVEAYINRREVISPPARPEGILETCAGTFVTLRTEDGRLRGCIGTISPSRGTVAEEIIHNAISAATRDPRFPPVGQQELKQLVYGVDVLETAEPARGPEDLDPAQYGVILESMDGKRRGLLLPRIEGVETVEQQWQAIHIKAGIEVGEPVRVQRFRVTRFGKQ